jgi:two-component system KDP operon response regulator KdpE
MAIGAAMKQSIGSASLTSDSLGKASESTIVVLLDPDDEDRRIEVSALRYGGFEAAVVQSVEQAVTYLRAHRAAALVVDPSRSDVTKMVGELRSRSEVPILVVSEVGGEMDVVVSLDAGADDFIGKPFGVEELLARLRAVTRRIQRSEVVAPVVTEHFTIDLTARRAFYPNGAEIFLTGVEFRIVEILLREPGHLVLRERILEEVWGPRGVERPGYLRVFVARIRQKLEPDPSHPRYVLTANGLGLVFEVGHGQFEREPGAIPPREMRDRATRSSKSPTHRLEEK